MFTTLLVLLALAIPIVAIVQSSRGEKLFSERPFSHSNGRHWDNGRAPHYLDDPDRAVTTETTTNLHDDYTHGMGNWDRSDIGTRYEASIHESVHIYDNATDDFRVYDAAGDWVGSEIGTHYASTID